jgi:hypothetical protein
MWTSKALHILFFKNSARELLSKLIREQAKKQLNKAQQEKETDN